MPIYSPVGYLDITNATLRTSNLEAQNLRINGGNIYVTSEITTDTLLNLENVTNAGNVTSNTVQFSNAITSLTAASNIVVTGNVTAATFIGSGAALTSIPPSAITGTLSQWSDGTNSDVYIASNVGIGNVHTLTSNTLQVGANLYVRDVDANVLTVTGNVAATYFEGDGSKLTGISATLQAITDAGNVTTNTLEFTNATTGFVTTSNIEVGGTLKINTITAAAYHSLQAVTNVGNVTSDTVQFSNATTSLTADSNIVVTGNVTAATFLGDGSGLTALPAAEITGTLDVARIPALDTAKITTGTLDAARIPALDTAKITTGTLDAARIPTLNQNTTGSAATLTTPRSIGGVNFDGSAAIVPTTFGAATFSGDVTVDSTTFHVDSTDNRVGIGTTSPGAELHVAGTGAIVIPSGTTAQQPTGVTGMIRFNTAVGKLEFYTGTVWSTIGGVNAIGGAVTNVGGYAIHTFTSSGTFTVNLGGEIEYLVVAGGGAGGTDRGGGGGAGGMLTGTVSISPGSYTITRGGGAAPVTEYGTSSGSASSIGSLITAAGGGGGGGEGGAGATGGSGGGSGYGSGGYGSGTSGQGNRGGSGYSGSGYRTAGGGGGAGTVGVNGSSNGTNGGVQRPDGGAGIASSISGSGLYYSGGGGGGRCDVDGAGSNTGGSGVGGSNVGGNGTATTTGNGYNGTAGRGGGGGGGGRTDTTSSNGGLGGSGIVIIRYLS